MLEEAADPSNPLIERAKFAAIVSSNLDEFFMVRVARLRNAIEEGDTEPDSAGLTPGPAAHAGVGSRRTPWWIASTPW